LIKLNTASAPGFHDPNSLPIRIWHWLLFLLITASITTVGLASFGFRTATNIPLVQRQLQQKGVSVDENTARAVSHAFNDKLWTWHTWLGYGIAALLLARVVVELFQTSEEKFRNRIRRALGFVPASGEEAQQKRHYLGVKWTYLVFYALILVIALTGLGLAFKNQPFLHGIKGGMKNVHSFTQYLIYGFILIHLVGVIAADGRRHPGVVSGMINGQKKEPCREPGIDGKLKKRTIPAS
jgi:cytochrome b